MRENLCQKKTHPSTTDLLGTRAKLPGMTAEEKYITRDLQSRPLTPLPSRAAYARAGTLPVPFKSLSLSKILCTCYVSLYTQYFEFWIKCGVLGKLPAIFRRSEQTAATTPDRKRHVRVSGKRRKRPALKVPNTAEPQNTVRTARRCSLPDSSRAGFR